MTVLPRAPSNIIGTLLQLISKLPPEALPLLEALIRAMLRAHDPMLALRIAALSLASKAGVHEIYDRIAKMARAPASRGRSRMLDEADRRRLYELARDQTG